jgi:hypothetical protein
VQIHVRFSPRALVGGNAGVDMAASAVRYADALREAIARDFAEASVQVEADAALRSGAVVRVVGAADLEAERATERAVLDLAWVVKQCVPWTVPATA